MEIHWYEKLFARMNVSFGKRNAHSKKAKFYLLWLYPSLDKGRLAFSNERRWIRPPSSAINTLLKDPAHNITHTVRVLGKSPGAINRKTIVHF